MITTRQTVLICDDTPTNIEMLDDMLSDMCDVVFATSGAEALRLAVAEEPDLILLDVMMPGMTGYEVCTALKAEPCTRNIPVIFVSALGRENDEAKGLEVGAIDYITKPISAPIVRARVRNHLELKRQRDLLEHLSSIDGLTGIANRRAFDEQLGHEWRRAGRTGESLAVLMIDVDHFKSYNDRLGHGAGDDCLKLLATTLEEALHRPGDHLARYGGEEFVCILPATDIVGATAVAEQLRRAVAALALPHPTEPAVSVSIGAATARPREGQPAGDLLSIADSKLYDAKRTGRNRVCA
jgi:diguanylate cyclase (GGDEF)-like protein